MTTGDRALARMTRWFFSAETPYITGWTVGAAGPGCYLRTLSVSPNARATYSGIVQRFVLQFHEAPISTAFLRNSASSQGI